VRQFNLRQLFVFRIFKHLFYTLGYHPFLRLREKLKMVAASSYLNRVAKDENIRLRSNSFLDKLRFQGILLASSERLHNGLFFESKKLTELAFELRDKYVKKIDVGIDHFHHEFFGAIGHIASGLGMYAKLIANDFQMSSIYPYNLKNTSIANTELVNILAEKINPTYMINDKNVPIPWHTKARLSLWTIGNQHLPFYWATAELEKTLSIRKSPPLLKPKDSWIEFANHELAEFGFSPDDWFVVLHIRETPRDLNAGVSVQDFIPLIKEITSNGGWVLRIGSPSASSLPTMKNVIDLTHSHLRNVKNHMFALSCARLFVASQSGPLSVPTLFGVPTLWTNAIGMGIMPYLRDVVALPVRFVDHHGKLVDPERHASSKWGLLDHEPDSKHNLESWKPKKNSSQDILDAYKVIMDGSKSSKLQSGIDFSIARAVVCPYPAPDSLWRE
jgi:putative glycosyltransferase (TIGR04372 family)